MIKGQKIHKIFTTLPILLTGMSLCSNPAIGAEAYNISVSSKPFAEISPAADKLFTRLNGIDIGVSRPLEYSFRDFWPPFWNGRGISSGDFDNDGDDDLVLASSDQGMHLFENLGGGQFEEVTLNKGKWVDFPGMLAGFVDLNDDGWLDIFVSGYTSGMHILWNENGAFDFENVSKIENNSETILAHAVSFGDVDHDGDLDLSVGNWSAGWYRHHPGEEARNRVIFNENGAVTGEKFLELEGFTGETLSIILSDINSDGNLDIIEGNDFEIPDQIYYGSGDGGFERYLASENKITNTTATTMSVKSTDFNGDLLPDLYFSQIAGRAEGIEDSMQFRPLELYCFGISNPEEARKCQQNVNTNLWYKSGGRRLDVTKAENCAGKGSEYEIECKSMMIKDIAIQKNDPSICGFIDDSQLRVRALCEIHFKPQRPPSAEEFALGLTQKRGSNALLMLQSDGTYIDTAEDSGAAVGGWAWDTKTEDFDLNGTIDIYVTNGSWVVANVSPSNMYFQNEGLGLFTDQTNDAGLEEYLILPSVTSLDFDGDGDLDLVGQAVNGPVIAMRNNSQSTNRIGFKFSDEAGNRFCVGCRIVIHQSDGNKQMREIQAGGGFLSYDAPKLYFGLGDGAVVEKVEVIWSTGQSTTLGNEFSVGRMYTITRSREEG
ncbi:hypothetical protein A9Q96_00455 [Rhodobacterales bacterium 52_120_T64]|nr:hypothetical protein A9Q96_00455 [Rhodobacterales bacterium 52_120_T64]